MPGGPFIERLLLDEWGMRVLGCASHGGASACGSPLMPQVRGHEWASRSEWATRQRGELDVGQMPTRVSEARDC